MSSSKSMLSSSRSALTLDRDRDMGFSDKDSLPKHQDSTSHSPNHMVILATPFIRFTIARIPHCNCSLHAFEGTDEYATSRSTKHTRRVESNYLCLLCSVSHLNLSKLSVTAWIRRSHVIYLHQVHPHYVDIVFLS